MDELSNDCDLENEDFDEDEDEDEYESNSINGRVANHEEANFTRSHKRKISTDSSKYCKKRKCRTTFSKSQLNTLETEFLNSNFVSNDRIDLIIELTGLDSRIIKNWFKNKRSRVLADTKAPQSSIKACAESIPNQILTNSHSLNSKAQVKPLQNAPTIHNPCSNQPHINHHQQHQLFIQTSNLSSNYKENRIGDNAITIPNNTQNYPFYQQHIQHPAMNENYYMESKPYLNIEKPIKKFADIHDQRVIKSNGLLNIIKQCDVNSFKKEVDTLQRPNLQTSLTMPQKLTPQNHNSGSIPSKEEYLKNKKNANNVNSTEYKDLLCQSCSKSLKLFCTCNVSKQALNKLYSNSAGYNMSFLNCDNEASNTSYANEVSVCTKTFEIL